MADACRNASCQKMHAEMHSTNRCVRGSTSLQQMCMGTHLMNRCVQESISQTDACGNASHQPTDVCGNAHLQQIRGGMHINAYHEQMHAGKHLTNRCMWECISPANRCVWKCIPPTGAWGNTYCQQIAYRNASHKQDACENASHQHTDACGNAYC